MNALRVNSVDVPILPTGHRDRLEDLGSITRSAGGRARSNVTADRGRARVRPFETPWIPDATASAIEAELSAVGVAEVDGYLAGGTTIQAFVRALEVVPHESGRLRRFVFEIHPQLTE